MTLCIAFRENEDVYLATDDMITASDDLICREHIKHVCFGDWMYVAFAGDFGPISIAKKNLLDSIKKRPKNVNAKWIYNNVGKFCVKPEGSSADFSTIVATQDHLMTIDSDGCCIEHTSDFVAIGNGSIYAYGWRESSPVPLLNTIHSMFRGCAGRVSGVGCDVKLLRVGGGSDAEV